MRILPLALCLVLAAPSISRADDPFQSAPAPAPDPFKMAPEAPTPKPAPLPRPRQEDPPLAVAAPPRVQSPARDGTWEILGDAVPNTRCAAWTVRVSAAQGKLSGTYDIGATGSRPIANLTLQPDGTFSGTGPGGFFNRDQGVLTFAGRFSGDAVSITIKGDAGTPCPNARTGEARRLGS